MNTIFFLAAALTVGQVQFFPDQAPPTKTPVAKPAGNAEARKELRDQVLKTVGQEAIGFTKYYGDIAIYSLQQCGVESGKGLVRLHTSGDLARMRNPKAVLQAIRLHGDLAAVWVVEHHEQLVDPDVLECWCREPMEYVYELKDIEQQAALLKASRKYPLWLTGFMNDPNSIYIVLGFTILLLLVVAYRQRKKAAFPAAPASP